MRNEKEIADKMSDPKLSEAEKEILNWVLESCSTCNGHGA